MTTQVGVNQHVNAATVEPVYVTVFSPPGQALADQPPLLIRLIPRVDDPTPIELDAVTVGAPGETTVVMSEESPTLVAGVTYDVELEIDNGDVVPLLDCGQLIAH